MNKFYFLQIKMFEFKVKNKEMNKKNISQNN